MEQDDNNPMDDFVQAIVSDPANPPDTILLRGYLGDSSEEGHIRLYFDPALRAYIEIPEEAILHTESPGEGQSPLVPRFVWIDEEAELIYGRADSKKRPKAKFFEGPIMQEFQGGTVQQGWRQLVTQYIPRSWVDGCPSAMILCVPQSQFLCPSQSLACQSMICPSWVDACPSAPAGCWDRFDPRQYLQFGGLQQQAQPMAQQMQPRQFAAQYGQLGGINYIRPSWVDGCASAMIQCVPQSQYLCPSEALTCQSVICPSQVDACPSAPAGCWDRFDPRQYWQFGGLQQQAQPMAQRVQPQQFAAQYGQLGGINYIRPSWVDGCASAMIQCVPQSQYLCPSEALTCQSVVCPSQVDACPSAPAGCWDRFDPRQYLQYGALQQKQAQPIAQRVQPQQFAAQFGQFGGINYIRPSWVDGCPSAMIQCVPQSQNLCPSEALTCQSVVCPSWVDACPSAPAGCWDRFDPRQRWQYRG